MNRNKPQECGDERGYNGWTNYETWNLKLWLDNDEPWYDEMIDQAKMFVEDSEGDKDEALSNMRGYLEEWVMENAPDLDASPWADLLNAGLREINYHEIAESYIGEAIEELKREKE